MMTYLVIPTSYGLTLLHILSLFIIFIKLLLFSWQPVPEILLVPNKITYLKGDKGVEWDREAGPDLNPIHRRQSSERFLPSEDKWSQYPSSPSNTPSWVLLSPFRRVDYPTGLIFSWTWDRTGTRPGGYEGCFRSCIPVIPPWPLRPRETSEMICSEFPKTNNFYS